MPDRFYGGKKDKYDPNPVYHRPKVPKLLSSTDYSNFCPPVRDQKQLGACTGFGIGGMAYTIAKALAFSLEDVWSPTWLYNWGRYIEGTLTQDAGAAPDDVCDAVVMHGLLYEKFWQYTGQLDCSPPSSEKMAEAIMGLAVEKIRVDNGVDGIISVLSDGIPAVAVGIPFPSIWAADNLPDILPIPGPNDAVAGWHEMFVYGHDISDPAYRFVRDQNSWNTTWGNKGRCKIPYGFFDWAKSQGGYDAHYFRMVLPPPVPPPIPPIHKKCWIF